MTSPLTRTRLLPAPSLAVVLAGAVLLATTACTDGGTDQVDAAPKPDGTLAVRSTDTECSVSADTAPSGNLVFEITNEGSEVTEFYMYAADGLRVVAELENLGPGLSRDLVLRAEPGRYITACKPGMSGQGIRQSFTVVDSGSDLPPARNEAELLDTANAQYSSYVKDQTEQLLVKTERFVDAYKSARDADARARYANTRMHWERIEPVAESFGDLDPRMDLREADLEPGQEWTGWHRIEKDLWPPARGYEPLSRSQRARYADQLLADTSDLYDRTRTLSFTADQIANGAKGLLDEVATSKVTGEEEIWSHTDLWDFQANIDGAEVAFEGLRPLLRTKDRALDQTIAARFEDLRALLDEHRQGSGFVSYTTLTIPEVKQLSDAVNALSEPLSRLTAAVTL